MKRILLSSLGVLAAAAALAGDLSAVMVPVITGFSAGAVNLSVSGGVAPYTYSWTGPGGFTAATEDISGLAPGTYTVVVTDKYCGTASLAVTVTAETLPTTVRTAAQPEDAFLLYPNPAMDELNLSWKEATNNTTVRLMDVQGRVWKTENVQGNRLTLQVGALPAGFYFIEWKQPGKLSRRSWIKK